MRIFLLLPLIAVVQSKTYLVETDGKKVAKTPGYAAGAAPAAAGADYYAGGGHGGEDYALDDLLELLTKPETLNGAVDLISSVIESGKAGDIANFAAEALGAVLKPEAGAGGATPVAGAGGADYALEDLLKVATKPETLKGAADMLGAVIESGKVPDLVNFALKALGAVLKPAKGGADKTPPPPPPPPTTGNRGAQNIADAAEGSDGEGSGEGSGGHA